MNVPALAVALLLALLALPAATLAQAQPAAGMVVTENTTFAPGEYRLDSASIEQPAITIRGDGITVDFSGVTLVGNDDPTQPDQFTGLAVKVEGNNVTVKNLSARGYMVALLARDAKKLTISGGDLSYNWRQRMASTPWQEDLSDWMSYHHNEEDEWLRFGAAVYLRNCDEFLVTGLKVVGGQNGLMITDCDDGVAHSNLISFNSSLGIGMYRSSRNRIMNNRLDFNVRGHSEGVYNRGQDSAAILIYEQSNENIFAWNSATHSGDGFFLWAGQKTMDTGEGGCNDNLLYENDFSYAPTNGVEITFSRNKVIGNRIHGCWHGIWGGYSYETLILANDFADNDDGINIEHGQTNTISHNTFRGDDHAIRLYERPNQDPNWGYPKYRDVRSRGYLIFLNDFRDLNVGIWARDTQQLQGFGNEFTNVKTEMDIQGAELQKVLPRETEYTTRDGQLNSFRPERIRGAQTPPPLANHPPRRDAIRVTEWGPYDYRRPVIWPDVAADRTGMTLRLLGPAGEWSDLTAEGATVEQNDGGIVRITPNPGQMTDLTVRAKWIGQADGVDEFGRPLPAGQPVTVEYRRFAAPIDWAVKFFTYDDATEPRSQPEAFKQLIAGEPVATATTQRLDYSGGGPWAEGVPADKFAAVAEGTLEAPEGDYVLEITSDDGVRVWLDDKLVLEDWTHHVPKTDRVPVKLGGKHKLRVEYFEIDGFAALKVEVKKP